MKALLFSYLLFVSLFIQGQTAVVSNPKMNMVYKGLDNPILVAVPGYLSRDLFVTSDVGVILKDYPNQNYYHLKLDSTYRKDLTISVFVTRNGKKFKFGEQKFRIQNIPEPNIMLGPIDKSGFVFVNQLKSISFVNTSLIDFGCGIGYTPVKYTIIYKPINGEEKIMYGNGPIITEEIKEVLNNVKSGDKIFLRDVTASGPSGFISLNQQLIIEVKD